LVFGGVAVGAQAGEFDPVLHRREAGVGGDPVGPLLDDLGVHRETAAAATADQVVAVAVGGPPTVEPFARFVAYDVHTALRLQATQCAVDGGQTDRVGVGHHQGAQLLGGHEVLTARERTQDCPSLPGHPAAHG
jgi:hypothetical protein